MASPGRNLRVACRLRGAMLSAKTSSFPKSMPRTARLTFTALPALFATICSTANAQQPPNTSPAGPSSVQLGTIEVVSPTGIATPQNQVASSVTVITAEDLERDQRRTAMDALQEVPGINVTQTGGPGTITEGYCGDRKAASTAATLWAA
jgi:outer membrane receptor for Fe3+-dicitrate